MGLTLEGGKFPGGGPWVPEVAETSVRHQQPSPSLSNLFSCKVHLLQEGLLTPASLPVLQQQEVTVTVYSHLRTHPKRGFLSTHGPRAALQRV